jgi:hypothetical protein
VLEAGELGFESDTTNLKIGDGSTSWNDLPYVAEGVPGAKGDRGIQGATGARGPAGAQGSKGDKGDDGDAGTDGISAYQSALNNGFVGTESEWLESLKVAPAINILQKTSSYTVSEEDIGVLIEMISSLPLTVSIPTDNVEFPVGSYVNIIRAGSGAVSVAALNPILTNIETSFGLELRAQWSVATIIKRASNSWVIVGDLIE